MNAPTPSTLLYPVKPPPAMASIGVCLELVLALLILLFTGAASAGAEQNLRQSVAREP